MSDSNTRCDKTRNKTSMCLPAGNICCNRCMAQATTTTATTGMHRQTDEASGTTNEEICPICMHAGSIGCLNMTMCLLAGNMCCNRCMA